MALHFESVSGPSHLIRHRNRPLDCNSLKSSQEVAVASCKGTIDSRALTHPQKCVKWENQDRHSPSYPYSLLQSLTLTTNNDSDLTREEGKKVFSCCYKDVKKKEAWAKKSESFELVNLHHITSLFLWLKFRKSARAKKERRKVSEPHLRPHYICILYDDSILYSRISHYAYDPLGYTYRNREYLNDDEWSSNLICLKSIHRRENGILQLFLCVMSRGGETMSQSPK
jgi:hypothetical protein